MGEFQQILDNQAMIWELADARFKHFFVVFLHFEEIFFRFRLFEVVDVFSVHGGQSKSPGQTCLHRGLSTLNFQIFLQKSHNILDSISWGILEHRKNQIDFGQRGIFARLLWDLSQCLENLGECQNFFLLNFFLEK